MPKQITLTRAEYDRIMAYLASYACILEAEYADTELSNRVIMFIESLDKREGEKI